jgi:hypothetical protein
MLIAPEPTITKVGGVLLILHGIDSLQAAIRGDRTVTAKAATAVAKHYGASDQDAQLIGDVVDIAVPLVAGGLGGLGRAGSRAGWKIPGFKVRPGFKIPGTGGYANWLARGKIVNGVDNDAVQQALKARSPIRARLAELGQRTLTNSGFRSMGELMGTATRDGQTVNDMVRRGIFLRRMQKLGMGSQFRTSFLNILVTVNEGALRWGTIATGPTAAARAWGSTAFPVLAGFVNALSKEFLFVGHEGQRAY